MDNASQAPLVLARTGHFFVGGDYVETADGHVMSGQMYVREGVPAEVTRPYPVVMIHGMGQTGTNYEGTPDGREGWAQNFVRAGYAVYVVDQPARGRSAYHVDVDGPTPRGAIATAHGIAKRFTSPAAHDTFGRAPLHSQWPGEGRLGDPLFDEFFRSQVAAVPTATGRPELLTKAAGAALLDRIGPAVLLTHSQSGSFGWQIADARPSLVKAILAIEPALAPTVPVSGSSASPYGLTMTPITYAPPLADSSELVRVEQTVPDEPDLECCWIQAEPARKLPNLAGIPIAIVIAEASPQSHTGHCTAKFLTQAGVANDFIRLEVAGIRGNGHMMMLEKNSAEVAEFLVRWLNARGC